MAMIDINVDPSNEKLVTELLNIKQEYGPKALIYNSFNNSWKIEKSYISRINHFIDYKEEKKEVVNVSCSRKKGNDYLVIIMPDGSMSSKEVQRKYDVEKRLREETHSAQRKNIHVIKECYIFHAWRIIFKSYEFINCTPEAKELLTKKIKEEQENTLINNIIKNNKSTVDKIDGFKDHINLYSYQKRDVSFVIESLRRNNGVYIGSDMGTGKTIVSLAATLALNSPCLIITKAGLRHQWKSEILSKTNITSIEVVEGRSYEFEYKDYIIINYDNIAYYINELREIAKDRIVICDESHSFSNEDTKRSKAAMKILSDCEQIIFMSGTPFRTDIGQFWSQLVIMKQNHKLAPDRKSFLKDYSISKKIKISARRKIDKEIGTKNLDRLRYKMRGFFIRTSIEEANKELPDKIRKNIEIDLPKKFMDEYWKAEQDIIQWIELNKGSDAADRAERAKAPVKIGQLRQISSFGKIAPTCDLIDCLLEEGEKVLVFGSFTKTLESIHKKYNGRLGLVIGGRNNQKDIDAFLNGELDGLVLNTLAGGTGLNLVEASNAIFIDQPWTSADKAQAEARIHRNGQTKICTIYNIIARNTVDLKICKLIESRMLSLTNLFGEEKQNMFGDDLNDMIVKFLNKAS